MIGACPGSRWGRADGACVGRARSEEEAMQGHRRRLALKRCTASPIRPKGYGGTRSSTVLAFLDNVQTFPASRRLVSDPAAPVTRPDLLLGQAPISHPLYCIGPSAASRRSGVRNAGLASRIPHSMAAAMLWASATPSPAISKAVP